MFLEPQEDSEMAKAEAAVRCAGYLLLIVLIAAVASGIYLLVR